MKNKFFNNNINNNMFKNIWAKHDKKDILYIGYIGKINNEYLFKYGMTTDMKNRFDKHIKNFETFELVHVFETPYLSKVERMLKIQLKLLKLNRVYLKDKQKMFELFAINDINDINNIIDMTKQIIETINDSYDITINNLNKEIEIQKLTLKKNKLNIQNHYLEQYLKN